MHIYNNVKIIKSKILKYNQADIATEQKRNVRKRSKHM